jgi:Leucine-rich repeat (LRR) protein
MFFHMFIVLSQSLPKLKILDLSDSRKLIKTPDLTGAPNLEKLIFQGCVSLFEVHPSIGVLKRLTLLEFTDCKSLTSFPSNINMDTLGSVIISSRLKIMRFPKIGGNMKPLSGLCLDGTALKGLPLSTENLIDLFSSIYSMM